MGLQWKKLGLWDYTLFEIGITEIMFEIRITGFQSNPNQGFQIIGLHLISNWDSGITCLWKLELWDCTPFEIGIMGLQDPPLHGPKNIKINETLWKNVYLQQIRDVSTHQCQYLHWNPLSPQHKSYTYSVINDI